VERSQIPFVCGWRALVLRWSISFSSGKQLADLNSEADALMKQVASRDSEGNMFIAEKLADLADHRRGMQAAIAELQVSIGQIQRQAVDETIVRQALAHISEVYECLPPYRRKDLIRLVLEHAKVSETELRLAIKGRAPTVEVLKRGLPRALRPQSGSPGETRTSQDP